MIVGIHFLSILTVALVAAGENKEEMIKEGRQPFIEESGASSLPLPALSDKHTAATMENRFVPKLFHARKEKQLIPTLVPQMQHSALADPRTSGDKVVTVTEAVEQVNSKRSLQRVAFVLTALGAMTALGVTLARNLS